MTCGGAMKEYIKKWKAEHAAIRSTLVVVAKGDIRSEAGRVKMREVKDMILKHLHSEDDILYPMLKKAARQNVNMTRMMEILHKEMDELAPKIIAFFMEYEADPAAKGVVSEFDKVAGLLRSRIEREESVLLNEFKQ
jgi:iron-sulfur cluster repair protein YtfE (RIC family)